jgi:hypothetical protein
MVSPDDLTRLFEHYGLPRKREKTVPVAHGKRLWAGIFGRTR